jgi:ATP-dependent Clp protease adaptor protein ClpS
MPLGSVEKLSFFQYHEVKWRSFLMPETIKPLEIPGTEKDTDELVESPARVILYNDEVHTFEEVIGQIIKATRCDTAKAEALTWEVHSSGKADVYEGPMPECLQVSGILEEIALHTQIEV